MNSQVKQIINNARYRVVIQKDDYYILDMDRWIWTFFIPFFFWLIPQRMYKVDKEIAETLDTVVYEHGRNDYIFMFSSGVAMITAPLVDPLLSWVLPTPNWIKLAIMGLYSFLIIAWRVRSHNRSYERLEEVINLSSTQAVKVRVRPIYFGQFLYPIFYTLIIGFLISIGIIALLETNEFYAVYGYTLFFPSWFFAQNLFFSTDIGKTNTYHVKILERNGN